jgi:hypothetical protein
MRSSCGDLLVALVVVIVMGIARPGCAQAQPGPATLENLVAAGDAQEATAVADAPPKRPAGTAVRPNDGVQHPDLDKAWAEYNQTVTEAVESIKAAIAKQFDSATAKGDLDAAEKWQAVLEKFETVGEVPAEAETKAAVSVAVTEYKKAREELTKSYEAVVKALTMEKKIAEARAARDECAAFRSASKRSEDTRPPSQPSPTHPPKALRMLVGSRWKYQHTSQVFVLGEKGEALALDGTRLAIWSIEGNAVRLSQPQGEWEDVMVVSPDGMTMAGSTKAGKPVVATRVIE